MAKLDLCRLLVEEQERRRNRQYQWIIKMRPDVVMSPPVRTWHYGLRHDTVYRSRNSGDLLMYIPRRAFNAVAHGWRSINCTGGKGANPLITEALHLAGFVTNDSLALCDCNIVRSDQAASLLARFGLRQAAQWDQKGLPPHFESKLPNVLLWSPGNGKGISVSNLARLPGVSSPSAEGFQ